MNHNDHPIISISQSNKEKKTDKEKKIAVAFHKWHVMNFKLHGMKTTEQLFDIFIKEYKP